MLNRPRGTFHMPLHVMLPFPPGKQQVVSGLCNVWVSIVSGCVFSTGATHCLQDLRAMQEDAMRSGFDPPTQQLPPQVIPQSTLTLVWLPCLLMSLSMHWSSTCGLRSIMHCVPQPVQWPFMCQMHVPAMLWHHIHTHYFAHVCSGKCCLVKMGMYCSPCQNNAPMSLETSMIKPLIECNDMVLEDWCTLQVEH